MQNLHKINFLPVKYREKSKNKVFIINFIIFFIIDTLLLLNIFFYKRKIEDITRYVEGSKRNFPVKQNNNSKNKNIRVIDNLRCFYSFLKDEIIVIDISSNEKEIEFSGNASDIKDYINFLEKVEKDKRYKIKNFNNISKKGKEINFNIKLEVK